MQDAVNSDGNLPDAVRSEIDGLGPSYEELHSELVQLIRGLLRHTACSPQWSASILQVLERFRQDPTLLDARLREIINLLCGALMERATNHTEQIQVARVLVGLANVRGWKTIRRFMPHEVHDFLQVLRWITRLECAESPRPGWQIVYCALLWMSSLVLVPFNLDVIAMVSTAQTLVSVAISHISDPGKTQESAVALASQVLIRSDASHLLRPFLESAGQALEVESMNPLLRKGLLLTLARVLKLGDRRDILEVESHLFDMLRRSPLHHAGSKTDRHLASKLSQRLALVYLPQPVVSWRYCRTSQRLFGSEVQNAPDTSKPEVQESLSIDTLLKLETLLDRLISRLEDQDTVVRWSAAKGIARIVSRLPLNLAEDVINAVLRLFLLAPGRREPARLLEGSVAEGTLHGACLCMGEFFRRGLLLLKSSDDGWHPFRAALDSVCCCLRFDVRRGTQSLGSNVRDAASYALWACARAYDVEDLAPFCKKIAEALIPAFLFDREVNCRRAAAAAFQEFAGRLNDKSFPGGLEISRIADYFSLGDRRNAYLELGPLVASMDGALYHSSILSTLIDQKIIHWDETVRVLAASALRKICPIDPQSALDEVPKLLDSLVNTSDLASQQGYLLALGSLIGGLERGQIASLQPNVVERIMDVLSIPSSQASGSAGPGNEPLCFACCLLIESLLQHDLLAAPKISLAYDVLLLGLSFDKEATRNASLAGLRIFFFKANSDQVMQLILELIKIFQKPRKEQKEGFVSGLTLIPKQVLQAEHHLLSSLSNQLFDACTSPRCTPEVRRESISASSQLVLKLFNNSLAEDVHSNVPFDSGLSTKYPSIIGCLLRSCSIALNDYEIDSRGDVGSWVRRSAIVTLLETSVIPLPWLGETREIWMQILESLAFILCGKLGRLRVLAREALVRLLSLYLEELPPQAGEFLKYVGSLVHEDVIASSRWFPRSTCMLDIEFLVLPVMKGLVSSAGSVGEQSPHALHAILTFAARAETGSSCIKFSTSACMKRILEEGELKSHLIGPILIVMEQLAVHRVLGADGRFDGLGVDIAILVRNQIRYQNDASRLLSIATILSEILVQAVEEEARRRSLEGLLLLLAHRVPRVRRKSAELLYVALLESPWIRAQDTSEGVLMSTNWESNLIESLRDVRNRIAIELGAEPPQTRLKSGTSGMSPE